MSLRDERWPAGTPCWADMMARDHALSWDFYHRVFGWEIEDSGPEYGHYRMAVLPSSEGRSAAGIGQAAEGMPGASLWTTYLATDDLELTLTAVRDQGGFVRVPPMTIGTAGRMAIASDPTGAVFGLWQALDHIGCGVVNEPGAVCWNECLSSDPEAARRFYAAVFGLTFTPLDDAAGPDYSTIDGTGPGGTIGGLGALPEGVEGSHWMTYVQVADTDATLEAIGSAGGTVVTPPRDGAYGRITVIADLEGALFSILQPLP